MIERCFELGLEAYEFSGPEEEYEQRFATDKRSYHRLRTYRPGLVNAIRYVYHRWLRPVLRAAYRKGRRYGMPDPRIRLSRARAQLVAIRAARRGT